jgi:GNAT superfamily N-acetyltransferase
MIKIETITPEETYPIRHKVLRKRKPLESCIFEGNKCDSIFHFGFFENNGLKRVVSTYKQNSFIYYESVQFQVREMAIVDTEQKKGYRKLLMKYLEQFLNKEKTDLIWFNARESAVNFYKKLNYSTTEIPFEIKNIGTHLIMFKTL